MCKRRHLLRNIGIQLWTQLHSRRLCCTEKKRDRRQIELNMTHTHIHNRFIALWILSGTTWVSRYQKKHSINLKLNMKREEITSSIAVTSVTSLFFRNSSLILMRPAANSHQQQMLICYYAWSTIIRWTAGSKSFPYLFSPDFYHQSSFRLSNSVF